MLIEGHLSKITNDEGGIHSQLFGSPARSRCELVHTLKLDTLCLCSYTLHDDEKPVTKPVTSLLV